MDDNNAEAQKGVSLVVTVSGSTATLGLVKSGTTCSDTAALADPTSVATCPLGTDLDTNPQSLDGTTVFVPKACTPCEPGMSCGKVSGVKVVAECPKGKYNELWGALQCETCVGLTAAVSTGSSKCQECAAGTTPSAAKDTCDLCPMGQYNTVPGSACKNW